MSLTILIILNLISYLISLKIFYLIFNTRYRFPFRTADIYTFLINIISFSILSIKYHNDQLFVFIFINLNLFYIFFHILNMIITSPRTKIILDLKDKYKEISITSYTKKYNCNVIVNNRINRLLSNKQIIKKNNFYIIKKNKNSLFYVSLVFSLINKI